MPSKFLGMDPYIEFQAWENFHTRFLSALSDILVEQLRPKYVVQVEKRVYLEYDSSSTSSFVADVAIYGSKQIVSNPIATSEIELQDGVDVVTATVPIPEEHSEGFLVIRRTRDTAVVTVIELLSPSNKKANTAGRNTYIEKRLELLQSQSNFVEIDLLRGGERIPVTPQPHRLKICYVPLAATVRVVALRRCDEETA